MVRSALRPRSRRARRQRAAGRAAARLARHRSPVSRAARTRRESRGSLRDALRPLLTKPAGVAGVAATGISYPLVGSPGRGPELSLHALLDRGYVGIAYRPVKGP